MLELPVWRAKQEVTTFLILTLYSTSQKNLLLGKWHGSLNYRQETCWHSLFGWKNGMWQHFGLHQCIWQPEKTPSAIFCLFWLFILPFGGSVFCVSTASLSRHISPISYHTFTQVHWSLWDIIQIAFSYTAIKDVASEFSCMLFYRVIFILGVLSHPQLSILIPRYI